MDRGPVGSGCAPSGVGFDSSAFRQASRLAWRVNRPWGRARFESGAHRKVWGSSPLLSANHGRVGSVDLLSEQLSWALVEEDLGDLIAVAAASYDPDGGLSVREHFAWFFEEEELLDAVLEGADEAIAESLGLVERAGGMSDAERKKFMDDVGVEPQMSKELIALVKQRQAEKKAADKVRKERQEEGRNRQGRGEAGGPGGPRWREGCWEARPEGCTGRRQGCWQGCWQGCAQGHEDGLRSVGGPLRPIGSRLPPVLS